MYTYTCTQTVHDSDMCTCIYKCSGI
uniref:Uncharacterized protein n=1 Tax=Anguilla anguilla TaxID=7936 RepID=A0A0E9URE5_ANGAN